MLDQLVADTLPHVRRRGRESGHVVENRLHEVESIEVVEHRHVEGRRRRPALLVAADVQLIVSIAAIRQAMMSQG
jgi:hypothetical protein